MMAWFCPEYNAAKDRRCELLDDHDGPHEFPDEPEGQDDVFPEWDAATELADDARRGK